MSEESMISSEAPQEASEAELNVGGETESQATEAEVQQGEEVTSDETASEDGYLYAGKYKSIEDFEKGHKELVKKLTEKNPGAPEGEYEFDFSENEALKDAEINLDEDALFNAMIPSFKELGITQQQAQGLMDKYLSETYSQLPDIGEELAKLGPNGSDMVDQVQRFVNKSFNESEREIASLLGQTAEGVQFLHKISQMGAEQPIPSEIGTTSVRSADEAKAEAYEYRRTTPNFETDRAAVARYEKMMDDAIRLELKEKKRG